MIKNKRGLEKLTIELLILVGIIAISGLLYILVFKGGIERSGRGVMTQIDLLGDYDGDGIINRDDVCCAAACEARPSQVDRDPQSQFYGCTPTQGPTNCTSSVCFLDYDRDHVRNEWDKCCAPQCRPEPGEIVDMECPGPRCGCAPGQKLTPCNAGPEVPCR